MLTISNRDRLYQVVKDARLLIEYQTVYYNLQNDEEVKELLGKMDELLFGLQQKSHEATMELLHSNLMPGKPDECQGNGQHPDFECCCDECDYYMLCFPNWAEMYKNE